MTQWDTSSLQVSHQFPNRRMGAVHTQPCLSSSSSSVTWLDFMHFLWCTTMQHRLTRTGHSFYKLGMVWDDRAVSFAYDVIVISDRLQPDPWNIRSPCPPFTCKCWLCGIWAYLTTQIISSAASAHWRVSAPTRTVQPLLFTMDVLLHTADSFNCLYSRFITTF